MRTKSLLKLLQFGNRRSASVTGIGALPVEILQEIFSYLNIQSLSRCCCVCPRWNACIPGDSTFLRSIFCFESVLVKRDGLRIRLKYTITNILDDAVNAVTDLSSFESPEYHIPYVEPTACGSIDGGGVVLNPAVWYIHRRMQPKLADMKMYPRVSGFDFENVDGKEREAWPPKGLRHLKDAYATAPPVFRLDIDFHYHDFRMAREKWEGSQRIDVENREGVMLRDLWAVFEKRVEEQREVSIGRRRKIIGLVGCQGE